jgi:XTP/dITP diphosphohydrolase
VSLDLIEPQCINPSEASEIKAKQAYAILKKPLFVTDTGLSLDAFNGFPGALIRFFNEYTGQKGILKLLDNIENRGAKAIVSLTFYDGKTMKTFEGITEGTIAEEEWPEGWEYDRIFISKGSDKTWAEMGIKAKNKDSYYKTVFERFLLWLEHYKA